jgi:hypothetical protein
MVSYVFQISGLVLERPLLLTFISWLGLSFYLIYTKPGFSVKNSFKELENYSKHDDMTYAMELEDLIHIFVESENSAKYRTILLGYVEYFQVKYPQYSNSPISFANLAANRGNTKPEIYYSNVRSNFLRHISFLYARGLKKFGSSIRLRISYSYFLNDYLKDKNTALTICYSCYAIRKSTGKEMKFQEAFHLYKLNKVLESYENNEVDTTKNKNTKLAKMNSSQNIFLRSSKEDSLIRQNITAIKRKILRNLIKKAI